MKAPENRTSDVQHLWIRSGPATSLLRGSKAGHWLLEEAERQVFGVA